MKKEKKKEKNPAMNPLFHIGGTGMLISSNGLSMLK